jgi:hypothetical protein
LQKSLAENVRAFETSKESEKKKLEEERKWVRREKSLFEKSQKDKKTNFERRAQDEVEELQNKVNTVISRIADPTIEQLVRLWTPF